MSERINPFSNGSQFADWANENCWQCALYNEEEPEKSCKWDKALLDAQVDDGSISQEVADAIGYTEAHKYFHAGKSAPPYIWHCPNYRSEPPPPPPFKDELTLPMFSGFDPVQKKEGKR